MMTMFLRNINLGLRYVNRIDYLPNSTNKQTMIAMMKSLDGMIVPDACNSSSQWPPVKLAKHWHSYLLGGLKSLHIPPLMHGSHRHSFSLTQVPSEDLNPCGQLHERNSYFYSPIHQFGPNCSSTEIYFYWVCKLLLPYRHATINIAMLCYYKLQENIIKIKLIVTTVMDALLSTAERER